NHIWYVLTATIPWYVYFLFNAFCSEGIFEKKIVKYKYVLYCFLLGVLTVTFDYYITLFLIVFSFFFMFLLQTGVVDKLILSIRKHLYNTLTITAVLIMISYELRYLGILSKNAFDWLRDISGYFIPFY